MGADSRLLKRMGERLRELRTLEGLTQEQVAERSGLSTNYVSELERGLRNPTVSTLQRLVSAGLRAGLGVLFQERVLAPSARKPARSSKARESAEPPERYGLQGMEPEVTEESFPWTLLDAIRSHTSHQDRARLQAFLRSIADALD